MMRIWNFNYACMLLNICICGVISILLSLCFAGPVQKVILGRCGLLCQGKFGTFLIFFVFLKWWSTQLSWSDSVTRNFSL